MNEASITRYIIDTFDGIETATIPSTDDIFFFYGPDRMLPLATLITNDNYDQASNLNRPSVFRLNVGISKKTHNSLFGPLPPPSAEGSAVDSGYDFTALDRAMPHPVYGRIYWVCVLNPSDETFHTVVRPLLAEAYELAVKKHTKRVALGRA